MNRKEFIFSVGKGVLIACSGACMMSSCSSGDDAGMETMGGSQSGSGGNSGSSGTMVNLEISELPNVGDQKRVSNVLFIRIATGNDVSSFVATEAVCPHQGGQLVFQSEENVIECQLHFAQYEVDGDTVQGPQNSAGSTRDLRIYATSLDGNTLTATVS
ncbi:QcrA and Rieske domain-containing protein [Leeuwenhoekiella blandensis]|uniref:Rieske domain-containing protein n=1 Tax=Leeuwenhoekiella blandensis (strain CECT 7118 / CCUG 51940 / KCTC 22103 / MED217) TaxID=398720 RepID=A3XH30_LEEBM|nr:Rieske 2Fe-2S domain-containing protein [Leeuwenhoekiella blandensis]EAQ51415.1 hypothetical protein MED217_17770 [Leeuwenhoekiella blandensis MED217]